MDYFVCEVCVLSFFTLILSVTHRLLLCFKGRYFQIVFLAITEGYFFFFLNYALPIICDVSPVHAQSKNEFVCSHRKQTNHIHHAKDSAINLSCRVFLLAFCPLPL